MRCSEAREILNRVMDGQREALLDRQREALLDGHPETRRGLAMEHVEGCAQCRQWHEGTQKVIQALTAAKATTPKVDLSKAIMAGLPDRHPVSLRAAPTLTWRKLFYAMAVCWLLGAMMTAAGIGIWAYYYGGSPHAVAVSARASAGAAGTVAKTGLAASGTVATVWANRLVELFPDGMRGMVTFVIVDALVLLLAVLVWRRRRALAGPFSVVW